MFGQLMALRERLRRRRERANMELTLENSNLTPEQTATALKALSILGLEERKGQLSKQDLVVFLYAMGLNPTDDIIDSKIRTFNLHNKKTFTFGQLAHLWHSMLQDLTDEDELLRRAFEFFDKDGNGEISVQELKTTMRELGDLLTEDEITTFMNIMDVNNDGAIGYTEFLATLKIQTADVVMPGGPPLESTSLVDTSRPTVANCDGAAQYDAQPLNVPAGALTPGAPSTPFAQHQPLLNSASGDSTGAAGPADSAPMSTELSGGTGNVVSGSPVAQLASGQSAVRRQTSLKPSLTPPPAAAAEPLLNGDAVPILQRPPSWRLAQTQLPLPPLEPAASQRRSADLSDANGLRAPSALEPGSGSDGGTSPAGGEEAAKRPNP